MITGKYCRPMAISSGKARTKLFIIMEERTQLISIDQFIYFNSDILKLFVLLRMYGLMEKM